MYAALLVGLVGSTAVSAATPTPAAPAAPACLHTNSANPTLCDQATNLYNELNAFLNPSYVSDARNLENQSKAGSGSVLADAQGMLNGTVLTNTYNAWKTCGTSGQTLNAADCATLNKYYAALKTDVTAMGTDTGNIDGFHQTISDAQGNVGSDTGYILQMIKDLNTLYTDHNNLNTFVPGRIGAPRK